LKPVIFSFALRSVFELYLLMFRCLPQDLIHQIIYCLENHCNTKMKLHLGFLVVSLILNVYINIALTFAIIKVREIVQLSKSSNNPGYEE